MRLAVAWHNIIAKPVQNGLTVLVVAMAITLMVTASLLSGGIHNGLVRATEPFDLIVGAKGSPNQLVLNTVFLQDSPIGNVEHSVYEKLAANPLVSAAIPLAFGDSYKGYRIIGAGKEIFQHQIKTGQPTWFQLAAGKPFEKPYEAVIGAKAARDLGLTIGDEFKSVHGLIPGGEAHTKPYQVVGILQSVQGPYDQAIVVLIDSIWEAHAKHDHRPAIAAGTEHEKDGEDEEHEEHEEHNHAVTAILVKPNGYGEAMRLYQQFQNERVAQMVFPAQVIVMLFALLGQGEEALKLIAYAIIVMGLVIMALSLYWSALSRARERAILRALGASAYDVFAIIFAEGGILAATGVALGSIAGHGLYALLAKAMASKTAITMTTGVTAIEGYILFGGVALGLLAGIIPAGITYRADIGQHL